MLARDVMTADVVTVSPDTPANEVARLLLRRGISAAPVVDTDGRPLGMVSEGDLIGRNDSDREARRDWWLMLLAEGEALHPDFLKTLRAPPRTARQVMAAPPITVGETTDLAEIARMLGEYRIKRVPVVRDGKVVGIVSRADLLRTLATESPGATGHSGLVADVVTTIEARFRNRSAVAPPAAMPAKAQVAGGAVTASAFRDLATGFRHRRDERRAEAERDAAQRRDERIAVLIDQHFKDDDWRQLLHRARAAAGRGDKELLLLRFPTALCSDRGRAINAPLPDWPRTLRGEAAEIYLRWERDLKPGGFPLIARVLDFPGGKPGDAGLFLVWGE